MKLALLTLFLSILIGALDAKPICAQAYSKTFVIKAKDGGKFRVKGYLRDAKGTQRVKVSVKKAPGAKSENETNKTEEKAE